MLSSCSPLAATVYKQRHDRVASTVHWSLLECFNQLVSCNYWDHNPTSVVEDSAVKVLWDFTDHRSLARHPDIVVLDKQQKMVQIIWRVTCEITPLVIGGLVCVSNMIDGYSLCTSFVI